MSAPLIVLVAALGLFAPGARAAGIERTNDKIVVDLRDAAAQGGGDLELQLPGNERISLRGLVAQDTALASNIASTAEQTLAKASAETQAARNSLQLAIDQLAGERLTAVQSQLTSALTNSITAGDNATLQAARAFVNQQLDARVGVVDGSPEPVLDVISDLMTDLDGLRNNILSVNNRVTILESQLVRINK